MAADERWYFTKEEINNSPSRKCGIDAEKELSYRQQGAKLIQDMGQRLQVTQLVINTAIVYMHRFYMFHPFTRFHRNSIAPAALFLAAKVEEQPRKLEHVIKVAHYILSHHEQNSFDTQSETYLEKAQELVMNENILLQTLGFDVAIDHPHTYVVKCFQLIRTTTELAQTSYFMATNSLHMTTMCLQYKPAVVACVCIYIVCKWSNYEIQRYKEGKDWFAHVDPSVTLEMLETLTAEFLAVLDKYPNRLKKLMNSGPGAGGPASSSSSATSSNITSNNNNSNISNPNFNEDKLIVRHNSAMQMTARPQQVSAASNTARGQEMGKAGVVKPSNQPMVPSPVVSTTQKTVLSHKEYSEKRDKERRERERAEMREKHHPPVIASTASSHHHHPTLVHGSSHISSSSSSSSSLHLRPLTTEPVVRNKPVEVPRSVGGVSSSVRGGGGLTYKESIPKRDISQVVHADDKVDIKEERTSVNSVDSAKFHTDRLKSNSVVSSDIMHSVSSDWVKPRHIDYTKVRKDLLKEKNVKHMIKEKVTESEKVIDVREIKQEVFSKHTDSKIKSENITQVKVIKTEKSEPKDEMKVQTSVKDIKPNNNSFIFNNNDFSLRAFLNPSEMPPEDIFDTEVDSNSKSPLNTSDFFTVETTHRKLNSPPRQPNNSHNSVPSSNSVMKGSSASVTKQPVEPLPSSVVENKPVSRHSNANVTPSNNVNLNSSHISDKSIGNGISGTPNSLPTSNNTLPVPSSRKKDKLPSPQCLVSNTAKVKLQRLETTVLPPSIKFDDKHCLPTKDTPVGTNQSTPKSSHHTSQKSGGSIVPNTTVTPSEKSSNSLHIPQTPVSFNPTKIVAEPKKLDALNIRLTRPENCDSLPVVTTSAGSSTPLTNSSSVVSSSLKGHKSDHRHKHKEKKKHKHKEKDKHRDKESKDHKKGKKHKKKDKEKDKERKEEKKSEKQPSKEDASRPLKITIKGISTPEVSTANVKTLPASPVTLPEKESSSSSALDTPARIKLTIPKSRLQGSTTGSHVSPPRGIPPKEIATPKVKLKIPKDNIKAEREKESRKRERDRSSPDNNHQAKFSRTSSSSYHAPQVLDGTRWSSQRP